MKKITEILVVGTVVVTFGFIGKLTAKGVSNIRQIKRRKAVI